MDTIAQLALLMILGLSIFNIFLIFGAPFGDYLWKGKKVLPVKLRLVSVLYVVLYAVFALILASKMGMASILTDPLVISIGMWIATGCFGLAMCMSFGSRDNMKQIIGPGYFVLFIAYLFILLYAK